MYMYMTLIIMYTKEYATADSIVSAWLGSYDHVYLVQEEEHLID